MKQIFLNTLILLTTVASPNFLWAQSDVHPSQVKSILTEPVALFMVIIACLLLGVIVVLGRGVMIGTDIYRKNRTTKNTTILLLALTLSPLVMQAQEVEETVAVVSTTIGGIDKSIFYFLSGIIIFEILIILVLLRIFYTLLGAKKSEAQWGAEPTKKKIHWIERLNNAPSSKGITDEELNMGHDFDGIQELDNPSPPWWRWGFALSVVFALGYMWVYEWSGTGNDQYQELALHTKEAEIAVKEYLAKSANNVNEQTVELLTSEADLTAGRAIFVQMCAACHANDGGGNEVGPNLTDDYWLHGGGIKDVFKTIKYGVPEKGMKSWQDDYSPSEIAQLASFVKSLKGSTPAHPKAPQGEKYDEGVSEESSPEPPVAGATASVSDPK